MALAECCIAGAVGFRGSGGISGRWDAALFGERQSRIVVSLAPEAVDAFAGICHEEGAPWTRLGTVGGTRLTAAGLLNLPVESGSPRPGATASATRSAGPRASLRTRGRLDTAGDEAEPPDGRGQVDTPNGPMLNWQASWQT